MSRYVRDEISKRAGDTEPLVITVSANGLTDLSGFASGEFFARKVGETTNHVDGAEIEVYDSAERQVSFSPLANGPSGADAFTTGDEGVYEVYVRLIFSDGEEARFPAAREELILNITQNFETL